MRHARSSVWFVILAVILAGCGDDGPAAPPTVATLVSVSGDGQMGTAGTALSSPLVVRALDGDGQPIAGATVSWSVTSGGGSVSSSSTTTGSDGTASVTWTLGPTAGAQSVQASSGSATATFQATAEAGPPASVTVTPSTATLTAVGATQQLSASVADANGNAIANPSVDWGSDDDAVATVDGSGLVTAMGNGDATITATSGSASGTATVTVAQQAATVTPSTTAVEVKVDETVDVDVTAEDANGNPVVGEVFQWSAADASLVTLTPDDDGSTVTVQGDAEGTTTLTVTSTTNSEVSATVDVEVVPNALSPSEDTEIGGTVTVGTVNIPAGVTVTVTEDLTLRSEGDVTIAGTLSGDCVTVDIEGAGDIDVTGTVSNSCADATAEGQDLRIAATGALNMENTVIESSGDVEVTNDPTLTEDDFPTSSLTEPPTADNSHFIVGMNNVQLRAPDARDGTDGLDGTLGSSGRNYIFLIRGNLVMTGDNEVQGQNGGHGGNGFETADVDIQVIGGDGGDGGDLKVRVTGQLVVSGTNNRFASGAGGDGGDATAQTTSNPVGAKAPSARADAGDGGDPGLLSVRANGGIQLDPGSLEIFVGNTGFGGDASAIAADGLDATATDPPQEGGDATANGGDGGGTPDRQLLKRGNVAGNPVLNTPEGGLGGLAFARAGLGGDGNEVFKDGAKGGVISAEGGDGGDALIKDLDGNVAADGGDGGPSAYERGNGGTGWSDCQDPNNTVPGGNGGAGGATFGRQGRGGNGAAKGLDGGTTFTNVANGGDGGDGDGPGSGGAAGADNVTEVGTRVDNDPTHEPGGDGSPCPKPAPAGVTLNWLQLPNTNGVVQQGQHTVALNLEDGTQVGSVVVETTGDADGHFVGDDPPRGGLAAGSSYTIALGMPQFVEGVTSQGLEKVQGCVSGDASLTIDQLDAEGNVLSSTAVSARAGLEGDEASSSACFDVATLEGMAYFSFRAAGMGFLDLVEMLMVYLLLISTIP